MLDSVVYLASVSSTKSHWKSAERKAEILLEMTLGGHHPKVVKISMITTILGELGGI